MTTNALVVSLQSLDIKDEVGWSLDEIIMESGINMNGYIEDKPSGLKQRLSNLKKENAWLKIESKAIAKQKKALEIKNNMLKIQLIEKLSRRGDL